jgi:hypothetical protein
MKQRESYRTAQTAGSAGNQSHFASEFASHKASIRAANVNREVYTCYSILKSVDRCKRICSLKKNSSIDDLVAEAQKLGRHRTKKEAIRAALDEYVRRRKQLDIIEMFGKIDYDESYDYKLERERNPNGDDGRRDQLRLLWNQYRSGLVFFPPNS